MSTNEMNKVMENETIEDEVIETTTVENTEEPKKERRGWHLRKEKAEGEEDNKVVAFVKKNVKPIAKYVVPVSVVSAIAGYMLGVNKVGYEEFETIEDEEIPGEVVAEETAE